MKHACALRILIGQRAMLRFFTLKGLNSGDIHAELISICEADALVL
jgi:hypothetical protein